ncbi:MAG TPA: ParB/RepB/Spo0J family partition protein [Planctomycetota bacterium]|nr:ParB/RepB/Spo0J family partition protein [Planctomycetota bacterium]
MKDNRRLGLGLDALLGASAVEPVAVAAAPPPEASGRNGDGLLYAPLDQVRPNPHQPRTSFDEEDLESLAASIKSSGVLQPIVARRRDGMYEIVAGERRFRAARRAGLDRIPVVVRNVDDHAMLQMALIENLQRRDLNPLEKARAFRELMHANSWSQEEAAHAVGLGRPTVANFLRLLELPADVQDAVAGGTISMGHARALLTVAESTARLALMKKIVAEDLSVRAVEKLASVQAKPRHRGAKFEAKKDAHLADLERKLSQHLGTKVEIEARGPSGTIAIRYYSNAQFGEVMRRMGLTA